MTASRPLWISWKIGLRGTESPARRIRPSLLYGVPILNVVLLAGLCAAVSGRVVTAPSMPLELPAAEFSSGAAEQFSATLLAPGDGTTSLLFFDGIRYKLSNEAECAALREAMEASRRSFGWDEIMLFSDGRVPHADVMRFAAEARRAGARTVNVAVREEVDAP